MPRPSARFSVISVRCRVKRHNAYPSFRILLESYAEGKVIHVGTHGYSTTNRLRSRWRSSSPSKDELQRVIDRTGYDRTGQDRARQNRRLRVAIGSTRVQPPGGGREGEVTGGGGAGPGVV